MDAGMGYGGVSIATKQYISSRDKYNNTIMENEKDPIDPVKEMEARISRLNTIIELEKQCAMALREGRLE